MPGTLEHTIHYVVEERLDLGAFDAEFKNDETGRRAYDPRVLLKVVLFGYARGLKGSRRLGTACRENVTFMALACGQRPDHSTIAAIINGMGHERIGDIFAQVLVVCAEEGLLGGTHFAIDGCRMSSNASKEWSGKRADLIRKRDKLKALVREAMREHRRIDGGEGGGGGERRRLERLEKKAERIERFLAENPARAGRRSTGRRPTCAATTARSSSPTSCSAGWPKTGSRPSTSIRAARGRTGSWRASTAGCATSAWTGSSSGP